MNIGPKVGKKTALIPTETQSVGRQPAVLLFGDSHSDAVKRAVERRISLKLPIPLQVHRLLKTHWKSGQVIGDTSFDEFLEKIRGLSPDDIVLSMIGGNQHAVFSTVQHPVAFDFLEPVAESMVEPGVEIIPYRVISKLFGAGLQRGDMQAIEAIRRATSARVVHIIPPPPKADSDFISRFHETVFAREGIDAQGVSPPSLRMKFWNLQTRLLQKLCKNIGVETLMPPHAGVEDGGFLARKYYAKDATHANAQYGELILREIDKLTQKRSGKRRTA